MENAGYDRKRVLKSDGIYKSAYSPELERFFRIIRTGLFGRRIRRYEHLTIACSDAKNSVRFRSGVVENTVELANTIIINVDCLVTDYECDVRIDTRKIPFYKCVEDVPAWWETYDGYAPLHVPDAARSPLYSA